MPTAEQVLAVARSQIGTRETPVNRQKYGQAYGTNGVAWCQIWVWWVFAQAGGADLIPKTAYTPTGYDWFKARGRGSSTPRPGDLVFFNWRDGSRAWPRPQHVGLVEAVNPNGSITTLEGNTQTGGAGNQSDGGGVWRRTRATSPYIVGYGRPAYSSALPFPLPTNLTPPPDLEDDLMASIPITPDAVGRFHAAAGAEAGGGSMVASRGWITFGSTYGGTTWTVAALGGDGKVLGYWPGVRTQNNTNQARELPAGTRAVTVEGATDNSGTRAWASTWGIR